MAEVVVIYGKSGAGKSRSLVNFKEDEIFLINTIGKRLPFKTKFKYTYTTDDVDKMVELMQRMPTKIAVIDDAGFIMTNQFMREHTTPKYGADQFKMYNIIADRFFNLVNACKALPEGKIVYIILHEDEADNGTIRLKTIGKLLDQKCPIESMVTICLRCVVEAGNRHVFKTQNEGTDISKSPEGMFDATIDNDLKFVDTTIREFWGLPDSTPSPAQKQEEKKPVKVTVSDRIGG